VEYRIIPVGNVVRLALIGKAKVRDGDRGHTHNRGRVLIARQVETMMFALTVVQGLAPGPVLGMTLAHGEAEDLESVQVRARVKTSGKDNGVRASATWDVGTSQNGADYRETGGNKVILSRMEMSKVSDAVMHRDLTGAG
jgi:hypothetical protein